MAVTNYSSNTTGIIKILTIPIPSDYYFQLLDSDINNQQFTAIIIKFLDQKPVQPLKSERCLNSSNRSFLGSSR